MSDPDSSGRTARADATRERIVTAAFALFAERGYDQTSLRAIAERAGCALGLINRYFPQREDLALELYARIATADAERQEKLRGRPLADAFSASVHARLESLAHHRDALRALAAAALDPASHVAILGARTSAIRDQVIGEFAALVAAAPDAPPEDERPRIARAMFVAQLFVVLAWLQDPSPHARNAHALIDLLGDTLRALRPMLSFAAPLLERYDAALQTFLQASHDAR